MTQEQFGQSKQKSPQKPKVANQGKSEHKDGQRSAAKRSSANNTNPKRARGKPAVVNGQRNKNT